MTEIPDHLKARADRAMERVRELDGRRPAPANARRIDELVDALDKAIARIEVLEVDVAKLNKVARLDTEAMRMAQIIFTGHQTQLDLLRARMTLLEEKTSGFTVIGDDGVPR